MPEERETSPPSDDAVAQPVAPESVDIGSEHETNNESASESVSTTHHAAGVAWAIGVVEILFATALSGFLFWAATQPEWDVHQRFFQGKIAYTDWLTIYPQLAAFGLAIVMLGLIPGITYIAAGFYLRKGSTRAGLLVVIVALVQSLVLIGLLVMRLAQAFSAADPPAMTMSVLAIGTPIAVLFYNARCSWAAWQLRYRS